MNNSATQAPSSLAVSPASVGERFPDDVMVALHETGSTMTCLPVQFDATEWQAAFYYVLAPEAACLMQPGGLGEGPFAVTLDADLHEHENASVIEIGLEIATKPAPVRGATLFLTGHSSAHFETLTLLAAQPSVPLFIGDSFCRVLSRQRIPLHDEHRAALGLLVKEAVGRDAFIRLSGRYDPESAFTDVVSRRVD